MKKIITNTFFSLLICMLLGTSSGEVQARYSTRIQKSDTITETKEDQSLATAVSVSVGSNHTCALTTEGEVKCWGANYYGQLGNDSIIESPIPVDVQGFADEVVIAVSAGYTHTCAVTLAGDVWCWGNNDEGQLGDETFIDRHLPVMVNGFTEKVIAISAGRFYTCALTSSGGIKCWGENDSGQLGDGTIISRSTSEDVGGLSSGVSDVSSGENHTCAVTDTGGVKCWGDNNSSQLGWKLLWVPVDVIGFVEKFMIYLPMIDR